MHPDLRQGLVVGQFGRHCLVQDSQTQQRSICHPRGKKSQTVVGDLVQWLPSADEGTVEKVLARRNVLYRQDELRTKTFAANLDCVVIWLAAEPVFSESQLTRALLACEAAGIAAVVVLNKADMTDAAAVAWERLAPYRAMGYPVLRLSVKQPNNPGLTALKAMLQGKTALILGPSGSGKSSFINHMLPGAQAATADISQALNSGKHTTTSSTWYALAGDGSPKGGALIDSPGFQEFGLHHIEPTALASLMPDFKPHLGQCKFYNCTHLHEPQCAVRAAVHVAPRPENTGFDEKLAIRLGKISILRYELYSRLFAELSVSQH